jgi:hypothetical protein
MVATLADSDHQPMTGPKVEVCFQYPPAAMAMTNVLLSADRLYRPISH